MYVFYVHVFIEYQNRNEWGKYTKISSSNIFVFILIWIIFNCIYDNYVMLFHYFFCISVFMFYYTRHFYIFCIVF